MIIIGLIVTVLSGVLACFSPYLIKNKQKLLSLYNIKSLHFWLVLLLSLYTAFSLVGGIFFLPQGILWRFKLYEFILYLLLSVIIFFDYILLIEWLQKQSVKQYTERKDIKLFYWQSFCLFFGIGLIYWIIHFPGLLSPDSRNVLRQVQNNVFHTHHTILYASCIKFLWSIISVFSTDYNINVGFLTLVQMTTFSLIYSLWCTLFYQYGFSKKTLLIVFGLFQAIPVNTLFMVILWKDIYYVQAMLLVTYLFVQFYINPKYAKNTIFLIFLGVFLSFVGMIRFNGIGIVLGGVALLFIYAFQHKNWKTFFIPFLSILSCLFIVNVILFNVLSFKQTLTIHKSGLVFQPINTAHLYGQEESLHPEILKLTEPVDRDIWTTATFDYVTSMMWGDPNNEQNTKDFNNIANYLTKDNKTLLKYYFYAWIGSPGIHLRTRLNFSGTVWNALAMPTGLTENSLGDKSYFLTPLWLTTIILLFYGVYCFLYKKTINIVILFPWIMNLGVLFFVSMATDWRYFAVANWLSLFAVFLLPISFQKVKN